MDTVHTFLSFLVRDEFNTLCSTAYIEIDSTAEETNQGILDMMEQNRIRKLI